MEKLQKLIDSVAADLDPDTDYKARLYSGGYRTPNAIKQADNAEQIERACALLLGDANVIWKAAGGVAGRQLSYAFNKTFTYLKPLTCLLLPDPQVSHSYQVMHMLQQQQLAFAWTRKQAFTDISFTSCAIKHKFGSGLCLKELWQMLSIHIHSLSCIQPC